MRLNDHDWIESCKCVRCSREIIDVQYDNSAKLFWLAVNDGVGTVIMSETIQGIADVLDVDVVRVRMDGECDVPSGEE